MKLALGTVQFGLAYGVANRTGQVEEGEVVAILARAREAGVDTLDTAISYGESEAALGRAGVDSLRVVTKLPALPEGWRDVRGWVRSQVEGSLARLKVDRLHGLLLHRPSQLLGPSGEALAQALRDVKDHGLVSRLGISIYDPQELEPVASRLSMDLVQSPFSLLDRRLEESGWLDRLRAGGTEIHVRSVFLQGLLLMHREQRPPFFHQWEGLWRTWEGWLQSIRLSPVQACLRFALAHPKVDRVVVGVDSLAHLKELLTVGNSPLPSLPAWPTPPDPALLNPSQWKTP